MMGLSDDHNSLSIAPGIHVQVGFKMSIPLQVVQKWLGHKTLNMTLRYSQLVTGILLKVNSVLERQGDYTYKSGLAIQ